MRSPLPSLIVSGQPFPFRASAGDLDVDLSRATQAAAHSETGDWLIWDPPTGYSVVAPFRHPEIGQYLKAHYCPLGKVWVNPARLSAISREDENLGLLYSPNFHDRVSGGYTGQQIADAVRRAGLTHTQKMDFIALSDVMTFDVDNSLVRLEGSYGLVELERHEAIVAIIEASDWYFHAPNFYGNPEQAQVLVEKEDGGGYVGYADDMRLSLATLAEESRFRLKEISWFPVAPGKSINLANVTRIVPSAVGTGSSWVHLGNGITVSCPNPVVEELQERRRKAV